MLALLKQFIAANPSKECKIDIFYDLLRYVFYYSDLDYSSEFIKLIYDNIDQNITLELNNKSLQDDEVDKEVKISYIIFERIVHHPELHYIAYDLLDRNIDTSQFYPSSFRLCNSDMFEKIIKNGYKVNYNNPNELKILIQDNKININDILKKNNNYGSHILFMLINNNIEFDFNLIDNFKISNIFYDDDDNDLIDKKTKFFNYLIKNNYNFKDSQFIEVCSTEKDFRIFVENGYNINSEHFVPIFQYFLNKSKYDMIIMFVEKFNLDLHFMYEKCHVKNNKLTELFRKQGLNFSKFITHIKYNNDQNNNDNENNNDDFYSVDDDLSNSDDNEDDENNSDDDN